MRYSGLKGAIKNEMDGRFLKQLAVLAVMTFLILNIFTLAFEKGPTSDIPIDVVDMDQGFNNMSISSAVIGVMSNTTTLDVTVEGGSSIDDALDALDDGDVEAVVVFNENFTRDIMIWLTNAKNGTSSAPIPLVIYVDGSNPSVYSVVCIEVQRDMQKVLVAMFNLSQPVSFSIDVVYGEGTDSRDFMAPAIAGLVIFMLVLLSAMMSPNGKREDDDHTLGETLFAQSVRACVIGMVLSSIALITFDLYGVMTVGDDLTSFTVFTILALASFSMGRFLSIINGRAPQVTMVILPLLIYPAILLGGIVIPVSALPGYLLPISYLYPLTYAIVGGRSVMVSGMGWDGCMGELTALVVYTIVALALTWAVETWLSHQKDR
ncbi:MAG: ABC transporter permease [Methanomassiliicoccales archaeon]|nr:ABC transporter permease [Methanomassiliicoccales archaeon]